ncbi:MAG TPA: DegV family protein [Thermoanaerobaculia bacterium]|nr:DegV family protein [Thermoanaerobaculia bacterium]
MHSSSVLVVDPDMSRRRELAHGLSSYGYEVIPAVDEAEGRRFAASLGPGIVVAPVSVAARGGAPFLDRLGLAGPPDDRHTLLLFGGREEEGRDLPEETLFLASERMDGGDLVRSVHLVLLGREVGLQPDARLELLVGDLSLLPMLELLRNLNRVRVSCRVLCSDGEIALDAGEVVVATAGRARGIKAFCRLSRLDAGPFWVQLRQPPPPDQWEIRQDFTSLVFLALEDLVHDAPDPRARIRVHLGPSFYETRLTPGRQELLAAVPGCVTIGRLLDALPATDGEILRDLLGLREMGILTLEEPEDLVRVVTDSTSDLPPELARAHGIHVIPVLVLFGDKVYHDGIDLKPKEFYELLEKGKEHPRTNPPPKTDFAEVYRSLAPTKDLVSVHVSEKLSQTLVHARSAAEEGLPDFQKLRGESERVSLRVVDGNSVSLGLGMLALFAARMARRGVDPDAIAERLETLRERLHVLFVVDTLEYLARGGRIGKARARLGNLLGIKPILGVVDGEVAAVDKVRGGRAAHPRLIELFKQRVDPERPVVVGVAHAKAPVWADRLRGLIAKSFKVNEIFVAEMGPVVAANAGPGTVGAALFQPTEEELPLIAPLGEGG